MHTTKKRREIIIRKVASLHTLCDVVPHRPRVSNAANVHMAPPKGRQARLSHPKSVKHGVDVYMSLPITTTRNLKHFHIAANATPQMAERESPPTPGLIEALPYSIPGHIRESQSDKHERSFYLLAGRAYLLGQPYTATPVTERAQPIPTKRGSDNSTYVTLRTAGKKDPIPTLGHPTGASIKPLLPIPEECWLSERV